MRIELRLLGAGVVVSGLCACATPPPATASRRGRGVAAGRNGRRTSRIADPCAEAHGEAVAALGPATQIRFDSGYEVWVYRFVEPTARAPRQERGEARARPDRAEPPPPSELVLLISPSGIVAKVRVRSATSPG